MWRERCNSPRCLVRKSGRQGPKAPRGAMGVRDSSLRRGLASPTGVRVKVPTILRKGSTVAIERSPSL